MFETILKQSIESLIYREPTNTEIKIMSEYIDKTFKENESENKLTSFTDIEYALLQCRNENFKKKDNDCYYLAKLTDEQKHILDRFVDNIEIEMEDLESARWDSNVYGVEPQYAVGDWNYDADEYFERQIDEALYKIKNWGIEEILDEEIEYSEDIEKLAVEYINNKLKG